MTLSAQTVQGSAAQPLAPEAEAARYALLRRLAPSMRHHLVVNLQPIGMIYEVLDRRLRAPEPKLADVHESAQKINGFARAALHSSLDVVTWLAPDPAAATTVSEGVKECLALVATSFTFRGYALRNLVAPGSERRISKCALRNVLTGALIHLSDTHPAPAEIALSAEEAEHGLVLTLNLRAMEGNSGFSGAPVYRPLTWGDLQALADAEDVRSRRDADNAVSVTFLWATAAIA